MRCFCTLASSQLSLSPKTLLSSSSCIFLTKFRTRGTPGEEVIDAGFNMSNERRRSNSVTARAGLDAFTTKFERRDIDADPVFEEELHGPLAEDEEVESASASGVSVEEEDEAKKA